MTKVQLLAAARAVNMRKLLLSVVLLRHMAAGCSDTQAALVGSGMVSGCTMWVRAGRCVFVCVGVCVWMFMPFDDQAGQRRCIVVEAAKGR